MLQIFLGALEKDGTDLYFVGFQNINQFNRLGNERIRIADLGVLSTIYEQAVDAYCGL